MGSDFPSLATLSIEARFISVAEEGPGCFLLPLLAQPRSDESEFLHCNIAIFYQIYFLCIDFHSLYIYSSVDVFVYYLQSVVIMNENIR